MKQKLSTFSFALLATFLFCQPVFGLANEQRSLFDSGVYYFDIEEEQATCSTSTFSGSNSTEIAYNFFISKGLNAKQTSGVVGNLLLESNLDPTVVSDSGYRGIAQWDKDIRWPRLVDWAEDNNRDEFELSTQLDYVWFEASERGNIEGIKEYDDIPLAAWYWGRYYEGAVIGGSSSEVPLTNVQALDERIEYAEDVFQEYGSESSGGVNASCGGYAINADGFHFPLVASQEIIKGGVDGVQQSEGNGGEDEWCWAAKTSCHHDYPAADLHAPVGTEVVVAKPGTVVKATDQSGGVGTRITVKGDDGLVYYYTHLAFKSLLVERGDSVRAGQTIGAIGESSQAVGTAPHLHFDVLPENYTSRVPCSGSSCSEYPFIDIQPVLSKLYNDLPE